MTVVASRSIRRAALLTGLGLMVLAGTAVAQSTLATPDVQLPLQDGPSDDYCIGCHSQQGMSRKLGDGSVLPLTIDGARFRESVHAQEDIACVDCHTGIDRFPHPEFSAESRRAVTLALYGSCEKCHAEQYGNVLDSVHQTALEAGNQEAAVCTDCHNPHQQGRLTDRQTGTLLPDARLLPGAAGIANCIA